MNGRFVSYLRASTDKRGTSGLGLDDQREAVTIYLNGGDWQLVGEVVEIESGKNSDRPQLAKALELCHLTDATLVVAKLGRLARKAAFIANLMESGVPFVACDMPHAKPFELHIRASLAEEEARLISQRTKAALAQARQRGVKLGGYRGGPVVDHNKATEARQKVADAFAASLVPMVREMRNGGLSLAQIAAALTDKGIRTARGGEWAPATVRNLLARR
jgi:DNA invertase Pin-like site-specific DNA recombinase